MSGPFLLLLQIPRVLWGDLLPTMHPVFLRRDSYSQFSLSVAIRCKNVPVGITAHRVEKYAMGKGKGDLHVLLMGASGEQHCGAC